MYYCYGQRIEEYRGNKEEEESIRALEGSNMWFRKGRKCLNLEASPAHYALRFSPRAVRCLYLLGLSLWLSPQVEL
uniref:Uncharacterized protein n=1 Tax=Oryza nivara TaxID=4536 RepID=A0A0E0J7C8_ORYNI